MGATKREQEITDYYFEIAKTLLLKRGYLKQCLWGWHFGSSVNPDDEDVYAKITIDFTKQYPEDKNFKRLHDAIRDVLKEYPFSLDEVCDCEERMD